MFKALEAVRISVHIIHSIQELYKARDHVPNSMTFTLNVPLLWVGCRKARKAILLKASILCTSFAVPHSNLLGSSVLTRILCVKPSGSPGTTCWRLPGALDRQKYCFVCFPGGPERCPFWRRSFPGRTASGQGKLSEGTFFSDSWYSELPNFTGITIIAPSTNHLQASRSKASVDY